MSTRGPRFDETELRTAITAARSWAEALRLLGCRSAGGNWRTLQRYADQWGVSTEHFDPAASRVEALRRANRPTPLEEILVQDSTYSRSNLKRRLLAAGIKRPRCELCGQGEMWRGRRMALILDHINGIPNDHRLENLRIVCPNCAATLATHCGAHNRKVPRGRRKCPACGSSFEPKTRTQRYCSARCGQSHSNRRPRPERRKVERPTYAQLLCEIDASSYVAVARKYGVSDNAVRKWIRFYERERVYRSRNDPGKAP